MAKATKKDAWFRETRGSYLPSSGIGILMYAVYLAYVIGVLVFVLHDNYSFWAAVFTLIPNWVAAIVIISWIAARKS